MGRGIGETTPMPREPRRVLEASRRLSFRRSDEDIGWETYSDTGSEFQLSDIDARNDFRGFEESEDLFDSDESEEAISYEGRGRVPASRRPRRSRAGGRSVHRRGGSGGRGSSDSRSPLSANEIAAGWSEDTTQPPTHPFTANPGMTVPIPTTRLGFFQLFVPFELGFFFFFFFDGGDERLCPLPESENGQAVFVQVEWY